MPTPPNAVPSGETIRVLDHSDLDRVEQLSQQAGFNQTPADWTRLLNLAPNACFAAVHGSQIVATTTTTTYSDRLAWIGMVVVDHSFRRLGIASRLVEHALLHLESVNHVDNVALDATIQGKQVYDRYGFIDQYEIHRLEGLAIPIEAANIRSARPMRIADLPKVVEMDAATLGAPRPHLIEELFQAYPAGCSVVEADGRIVAWSFRRPGAKRWHIGPIGASNLEFADIALQSAMAAIPGEPVEVDVIEGSQHAYFASRFTLSTARSFMRMVRGQALPIAHDTGCYATAAPELG